MIYFRLCSLLPFLADVLIRVFKDWLVSSFFSPGVCCSSMACFLLCGARSFVVLSWVSGLSLGVFVWGALVMWIVYDFLIGDYFLFLFFAILLVSLAQ